MRYALLTLALDSEEAVVSARQRVRSIASLLGFDPQDQTRIATAVSEIARNAVRYARGGRVECAVESSGGTPQLVVTVSDRGAGIRDLDAVLAGEYASRTGLGLGLVGARRLMDRFRVESEPGRGTRVLLGKNLPGGRAPDAARAAEIGDLLARERPVSAGEEVARQNRELLETLALLRARQDELVQLNRELEDTNRGVVALYAELDERASALRLANEIKAQFLSYMSHEFRTPLDSILFISQMLLERRDGELTEEQETQVRFMVRSARELLTMVDDLLESARVDSGQVLVRPRAFQVEAVFSSVRALLKPFVAEARVPLVFEEPADVPELYTDESKLAQILRNLLTNALKFTEAGEVRVGARYEEAEETVCIAVRDTGIGIAPADVERIFRDFGQVEGPVQRRVRGTGLGLPLSRKLARLLGGDLTLESEPGVGSTFTVAVPRVYAGAEAVAGLVTRDG